MLQSKGHRWEPTKKHQRSIWLKEVTVKNKKIAKSVIKHWDQKMSFYFGNPFKKIPSSEQKLSG